MGAASWPESDGPTNRTSAWFVVGRVLRIVGYLLLAGNALGVALYEALLKGYGSWLFLFLGRRLGGFGIRVDFEGLLVNAVVAAGFIALGSYLKHRHKAAH